MKPRQRIVRARRQYNQWVGSQTLEDYALRYTAAKARKSAFRVGNTALGAISFLACEAVGGAITIAYGFPNAPWAIAGVALLMFLIGISIGSLYQYFPDKSALIRTLAELYNAGSRRCIAAALEGVKDLKGLLEAYCSLVDQYFAIVTAEPVMRDIWSGMQADKQLMALQLAESRICGEMLASAMRRVHPKTNRKRLDESAFLIWELGEATVRLAISVPPKEGRALVETFKRITVRELEDPPPSLGD